ncbi:aromatase/cyclase [Actinomadura violacea]|uniref:Aromatase/cyclase n=1 Tax=Actinomadura violacea TaxID=2819934 RepID=A0ABS3RL47_9ACTN|nr:aromatase/cyclase [Actinomadura violacea]MBO2457460.1 aromatase/cyclase [Actinomadura violacea]
MTEPRPRSAEHAITVDAPAEDVYRIVATAVDWPVHFPPTVHVDLLDSDGAEERIRIWATANDEVKCWTSRRVHAPDAMSVKFRQEVTASPVAFMRGEWRITPLDSARSRVTLLHTYGAIDDDPRSAEWIGRAVDGNSGQELAKLKRAAEMSGRLGELLLSFEDSVTVAAGPEDVYDFLYRAAEWPRRIPHVSRLELTESTDGVQRMAMDTRTADGSVHTTESVRVCLPPDRIVYKQMVTPALMTAHTGSWHLTAGPAGGTVATARHTVLLAPDRVRDVLGPDATIATAREFVRKALGGNSTVTLRHAKAHAEAPVRGTAAEGSLA